MTKSNKGLFSNQGDVTSRLMVGSSQFSNLFEISSMFTLSADPIKIEQATLMTMSNRVFFSNQGDVSLRLMTQSGQFSNLVRDLIHVHFICKFQEHLIKTEGVMVITTKVFIGFP